MGQNVTHDRKLIQTTERKRKRLKTVKLKDNLMEYDFPNILPFEITEIILKLLNAKELSRFQSVCWRWREFGNSDSLWIHFCMKKGWLKYGVNNEILKEEPLFPRATNVSGNSPLFDLRIPDVTRFSPICKWKHLFLRLGHLDKNWSKGRYNVAPVLRGHKDKVTAFDCEGHCLVSGSDDHTVRVWDLRTCTCIRRIGGHSDSVTAVRVTGNMAITGCGDSAVRVIDICTGKIVLTFFGHGGSVDHIHVVGSNVISAGSDRTVRVWSLTTKELVHVMRLHTDEIECMAVHGRHVVTGSWDNSLVLWDIESGKSVHQCVGHEEVVTCCQFDAKKIVSGSADGDVRIWSCLSGLSVRIMSGHQQEVYCVAYNDEVIASGSADSTVILWSPTGQPLGTLREHMGVVRCLHINNERLVSGGDQSMIVVWDYRAQKKLTVLHRHPSKLHLMWVGNTKLITASPEKTGTLTVLSFW